MRKQKIKENLLTLFYPRRCAICDRALYGDAMICPFCEKKVKVIEGDTCIRCGKVLKNDEDLYCYDCKRKHVSFDRGTGVFEYDFIKESLFRFKYGGRAEYARFYAKVAWERYKEVFDLWRVDALIPVPIHRKRFNKRGYNQAAEFASCLSEYMNVPVMEEMIVRNVNTVPLKRMGAADRQKNLKKAFKLTQNDVKFKKVCIVDDIYTTGSTIDALATILKEAGVQKVYFITVAIGAGL